MRLNEIEKYPINILDRIRKNSSGPVTISNGMIDIDGNYNLEPNSTKLPVKFGSISGDFDCNSNKLTSLQGAPTSVSGDFDCNSNQLTSLQGAPVSVGEDFYCYNNQLTSLQGAPTSVGGYFRCNANLLTSLQGAPTSVGGDFYCGSNQLTSLQGAPTEVGGNFDCGSNRLTSLQGAPQSVGGHFYCNYNENLELLKLLFIKKLKSINIRTDIDNIMDKYIGKGPGGALACAAELIKAGFRKNARR